MKSLIAGTTAGAAIVIAACTAPAPQPRPSAASPAAVDRTVLPIPEPNYPHETELDARKATPPLFQTMEVLGKERCRRRLRHAIAELKAQPAPQPVAVPGP